MYIIISYVDGQRRYWDGHNFSRSNGDAIVANEYTVDHHWACAAFVDGDAKIEQVIS